MNRLKQILFCLILFSSSIILAQVLPVDVAWNEEETGYYTLKENNIVLVSTKGEEDKIILSQQDINNIEIESFFFSKSKRKVLLFTKSLKVWRYKTRGDYWVYNFDKKKIKKIGEKMSGSSLMFAKFSPDEQYVAYVSKEKSESGIRNSSTSANIYIENLENKKVKKLTSSNGTKKAY